MGKTTHCIYLFMYLFIFAFPFSSPPPPKISLSFPHIEIFGTHRQKVFLILYLL